MISGRQEVCQEATQIRLRDITAFMANETLAPAKKRKMTAEEDVLDSATGKASFAKCPFLDLHCS